MVNGSLVLALEKSKDFDNLLNHDNPHRQASKEEVEKVFEEKFGSLEDVVTSLQKVGLYLSSNENIAKPENLPHVISKWPIMYNYSQKVHPYGIDIVGYVKVS